MSMSDTIADMLTRIRNAQSANHANVSIPSSKTKVAVAQVLLDEGYITGFEVVQEGVKSILMLTLKYYNNRPVIETLDRISRPGLRIYKSSDMIPRINGGLGVIIVSTSKGIMTDKKARSLGVGGELLCSVS
ncbi:MAG: 30S ribosomal protein S8 [Gammaproteobacteria bacterium]